MSSAPSLSKMDRLEIVSIILISISLIFGILSIGTTAAAWEESDDDEADTFRYVASASGAVTAVLSAIATPLTYYSAQNTSTEPTVKAVSPVKVD